MLEYLWVFTHAGHLFGFLHIKSLTGSPVNSKMIELTRGRRFTGDGRLLRTGALR